MSNPVLPAEARDHRERGWFWANDEIIDRYGSAIGADGVAVYMALARHADRNGQCWPSYATMAERLGLSRPTVIKCLARLVFAGLVTCTTRMKPGKSGGERPDSNLYTLHTVRSLSDEERESLKKAIKDRESGKGDLPPLASNGHSKQDLPPLSGKGDLPVVVKEIYQDSKSPLPGVVKEIVRKEDSLNQTHVTTSASCETAPVHSAADDDVFFRELRRRSIGTKKARQIASMGLDMEQTLARIDNRPNRSDPHSLGLLLNDITDGVLEKHQPARAPLQATPSGFPDVAIPITAILQARSRHGSS